ncbi:putative membrane protein YczE [Herbihabitans rhizosphaerae]|uniref:Putative membrane protein YczE n=1 Tax=Herbihabitans rhizosphaerae TaxID=1872711 RepID=A0A4Q7L5U2_9PSEU|nr:hypothetical protein [Herbihabitans rhizosphaerae]RZS44654.1 putative membrane protein YczE [Herbihabitans rhizosphaerae]
MRKPVDLAPVTVTVAPVRRLAQLLFGLALYGSSAALTIRATLGLNPWNVLHEAISKRTGLSFGTVVAIVGVTVLLAWLPLRQRPGIGTVANVVVTALAVDATLAVVPAPTDLVARVALLVAGVTLNGLAVAIYVGARLGPGPRDGLMTGIHARTRVSVRMARTAIEVVVLVVGWLLGGTVGVGTVIYALAIGPLAQLFLPRVAWRDTRD